MYKLSLNKYMLFLAFFLVCNISNAQFVSIGGAPTSPVPCDTTLTLSAIVNSGGGGVGNGTDSYTVSSILYSPYSYSGANTLTLNGNFGGVSDDWWSTVVPLPFTFCFFGNSFNNIVVGQNGQVGFDLSVASGGNGWSLAAVPPLPFSSTSFNNCIMAPFYDAYPYANGAGVNIINWDVYGVAPNRKFVVSWNDCPMFSCTSVTHKSQVVLHEGSNIIDINIANKNSCSWNSDLAIEGIQNDIGTIAYTVPGRNVSVWTATNDSYRFTPAGTAITLTPTYSWIDSTTGLVLGTGSTYTVSPPVANQTIILNVTAPGACAQLSGSDTARIESGIIADFDFQYQLGCSNDTVVFTNLTSPGTGNTYSWNFGDGGTSNQANPTHIYLTQGVYNVRLIASHPPCTPDTMIKTITINHPLNAGFTQDKTSVCENDPITFTDTSIGGIVSWVWTMGDGTTINNQTNFTHTYLTNGTFVVKLVVTDTLGCKDSATVSITNSMPFANFSVVKNLGCLLDTVIFTNTSTNAANYVWAFGDSQGSSQTSPSHVYQSQNVYNVTLIASNGNCADTVVKPVDINHPLAAQFGVAKDSICLGELMIVADVSIGGGLTLDWNWGDGTPNSSTSPTQHSYTTPGSYTITLVITDTLGCKDSISKEIYVDNPPFVQFNASKQNVCVGEPILFTDTVAPFTVDYIYNFGDGKTQTNTHNPTHTYDLAGNYVVSLTGTYLVCPNLTVTKNITVNDFPLVNLGPDTAICPNLTGAITLSNLLNASALHTWSTGDISNSINVTQPGFYWVKANNNGCESSDSIWVKNDCYISFPNSFSPNGDGQNDYFIARQLESMGVTKFNFNIFNRWGELVFTTTNLNGRGWDGKFGGKDQPVGIYVYYMDAWFRNGTKKSIQGNFTLLR